MNTRDSPETVKRQSRDSPETVQRQSRDSSETVQKKVQRQSRNSPETIQRQSRDSPETCLLLSWNLCVRPTNQPTNCLNIEPSIFLLLDREERGNFEIGNSADWITKSADYLWWGSLYTFKINSVIRKSTHGCGAICTMCHGVSFVICS